MGNPRWWHRPIAIAIFTLNSVWLPLGCSRHQIDAVKGDNVQSESSNTGEEELDNDFNMEEQGNFNLSNNLNTNTNSANNANNSLDDILQDMEPPQQNMDTQELQGEALQENPLSMSQEPLQEESFQAQGALEGSADAFKSQETRAQKRRDPAVLEVANIYILAGTIFGSLS